MVAITNMHKINEKIVAFLDPETIEPKAKEQLRNISEMPFIFKHLAVMPDCHLGKGATVGSVVATKGAIIPAAVGVDIGCGMIAVKTKFFKEHLPSDLSKIRIGIERRIPLSAGGFNQKVSDTAQPRIDYLKGKMRIDYAKIDPKWEYALGSLGSGNHFIEVTLDENNQVWAFLHSGSRGIGNKIASKHIDIAKKFMGLWHIQLKDPDLAYLPEGIQEFDDYIQDMQWAQEFAFLNREEMMDRVLTELSYAFYGENGHQQDMEVDRVNCHHNFTQKENHFGQNVWLTRKGAIQASAGVRGLIPGSMGTKSYVVRGLGNPMSFNSAPHGAGRNFSRTEARRRFTMADLEKAMEGKEWRKTNAFIDELPGAYKPIETVMENAKELVAIEHTLNQIINVKGD